MTIFGAPYALPDEYLGVSGTDGAMATTAVSSHPEPKAPSPKYFYAAYGLTWLGVALYVGYLAVRIQTLSARLRR